MKFIGFAIICFAIFIVLFSVVNIFQSPTESMSPIEEDDGVRVIYITPTVSP